MTKKWFLMQEANRNMNVAMVCTDAIYAISQLSGEQKWDANRLELSVENAKSFLEEFSLAIESLYTADVVSDPFMFSLADEITRFMGVRPKQLLTLTKKALLDMSEKSLSPETYTLLTSIIKITQQAAVRKCESIKPIIL